MEPRIIIKKNLPPDNPPHKDNDPILIHRDSDLGWIVEKVNDGEYEVQELPFDEKFNQPNIELAKEISNGQEIWICPSN